MANEGIINTTVADIVETLKVRAKKSLLNGGIQLRDVVNTKYVEEGKSGVTFYNTSALSYGSYAEGVDIGSTYQDLTLSATSITPSVRKAFLTFLSDVASHITPAEFGAEQGERFAKTLMVAQNDVLWAEMANATNSLTGGGATTDITEDMLIEASTRLQDAGAPGPYVMPVTRHIMQDLLTIYKTSTSFSPAEVQSMAYKGFLPELFGITPLLVGNLSSATKDAASVTTAAFSPEAIGFGILRDASIEYDRKITLGGWEIVGSTIVDAAVVNPDYIYKVTVDNNDAV